MSNDQTPAEKRAAERLERHKEMTSKSEALVALLKQGAESAAALRAVTQAIQAFDLKTEFDRQTAVDNHILEPLLGQIAAGAAALKAAVSEAASKTPLEAQEAVDPATVADGADISAILLAGYLDVLLGFLSDLLRSEFTRKTITPMAPRLLDAIAVLVAIPVDFESLSAWGQALIKLCVRSMNTVSNLCYEHDDHGALVSEVPGFLERLYKILALSPGYFGQHQTLRAPLLGGACSVLANMLFADEALQARLVGQAGAAPLSADLPTNIFPLLLEHLRHATSTSLNAISTVIQNLLETDEGAAAFLEAGGLEAAIDMATGSLDRAKAATEADQRAELLSMAELAFGSLAALVSDERFHRPVYQRGLVDRMVRVIEDPELEHVIIKRSIAKTVAIILSNDENMRSMFEERSLDRFSRWIEGSTDIEVKAYATFCVSNLARSDDYASAVMAHDGLIRTVFSFLRADLALDASGNYNTLPGVAELAEAARRQAEARQSEDPELAEAEANLTATRLVSAALSIFRNIVLLPENKAKLRRCLRPESGTAAAEAPTTDCGDLLRELLRLVVHSQSTVSFVSVIILKNMLVGNEENGLWFVGKTENADGVRADVDAIALLQRLRESKHDGIRTEAARILVVLSRLGNPDIAEYIFGPATDTTDINPPTYGYPLFAEIASSPHSIIRSEALEVIEMINKSGVVAHAARMRDTLLATEPQAASSASAHILQSSLPQVDPSDGKGCVGLLSKSSLLHLVPGTAGPTGGAFTETPGAPIVDAMLKLAAGK
ncbi:hypothetical protein H696_03449 [Fonticula alba]|uniref:Uncharacterized protein n=1 Tax=Fonticula alba TaxID=691883 RepID=A0A058Z6U3_FONAL|nr:hypothetical protein H696_03449 [Fonticula alba]KCV69984.1 hypothetical protein H696_03449 [Fonticula alba]|eukprot:XP_009495590.1 hypothetical protein H696_03449 [Fonticula alba]